MRTGKMNSYKKMGMVMLTAAIIGGALGFLIMLALDGRADSVEAGMTLFLTQIQRLQLPIMVGITVLSVIFGEVNLKKLKTIGIRILETEDEECDKWEYQEEKTGACGVVVNILSQVFCILILSVGYSVRYITDNHHRSMLAVCLVFLACYAYDGFWQARYVRQMQYAHPEKKGDPASRKFQQQWLESCDEAEKEVIFRSAYKAYIQMNTWIPVLLVITMLGHLFFGTGIMAIVVVAAVWLVITTAYLRSCVSLRKEKLRE